jgi:hypothetical protein
MVVHPMLFQRVFSGEDIRLLGFTGRDGGSINAKFAARTSDPPNHPPGIEG